MKSIYYISRSYPGFYDTGGGALMREAQVNALKKSGFHVTVVLPNYGKSKVENLNNDILLTPYKINERLTYYLHSKGKINCYLNQWIKSTIKYLKNIVTKDDIVFATTGGEIGTLIIASELKKHTNCKTAFNYHDPIANTTVFNLTPSKAYSKLNKNKIEGKHLKNIDLILTSSLRNKNALQDKFPFLAQRKIYTIYFGYLKDLYNSHKKNSNDKTTIVYGGSFTPLQKPELLISAARELKNVEIVYIGNHKEYLPIQQYKNECTLLPAMSYDDYITYLKENADIGFVALSDEYYGACVPSKIFEYLNIGLPIIGALPNGDAMDIINKNEYGIASHYSDLNQLTENIQLIIEEGHSQKFKENIIKNREKWSMDFNNNKLLKLLQQI